MANSVKTVQICVASNILKLHENICARLPSSLGNISYIKVPRPADGYPESFTCIDPKQKALLNDADVLVTDPDFVLKNNLLHSLPKLRWMQLTWAGVDSIIRAIDDTKPLPDFTITRLAGCFGPIIGDYVIGNIICHERQMFRMKENQSEKFWDTSRGFSPYRLLSNLSIAIIGVGDIGKGVAQLCKAHGMKVWGVVRTIPKAEKRSQDIDVYKTMADLPGVLQACDYVCNILPSTPQTNGIFDREMFKHCRDKKSVFINVGRGNVVSETSMIEALNEGWLSHAILDVFDAEPLPPESSLWLHPNVTVTPHVSGVSPASSATDVFVTNLERLYKEEPLEYIVDLPSGY